MHIFFKGEQAYTRLFGLWPSGQGGTCYILAQIQRRRKSFFVYQFNNIDKMSYYCMNMFLKGKQPYTRFFDNKCFPIRGAQNLILAWRRVESNIMQLTFYVKSHLFLILHNYTSIFEISWSISWKQLWSGGDIYGRRIIFIGDSAFNSYSLLLVGYSTKRNINCEHKTSESVI